MRKITSEAKMVSVYRPHMKIIGDILSTTRDDLEDSENSSCV